MLPSVCCSLLTGFLLRTARARPAPVSESPPARPSLTTANNFVRILNFSGIQNLSVVWSFSDEEEMSWDGNIQLCDQCADLWCECQQKHCRALVSVRIICYSLAPEQGMGSDHTQVISLGLCIDFLLRHAMDITRHIVWTIYLYNQTRKIADQKY